MTGLLLRRRASRRGCLLLAVAVLGGGVEDGRAQPVRHATGQEVVPAYEGWERNPDGSFNLLLGTMNRNWEEALDIPIGPANQIEPGGPDQGQPTHFLPRRNRFLFRIRVPSDFGDKELIWTLTSPNGKTKTAYASLHPDYYIDDIILQRNNGAPTADWLLTNTAPELEVEGETTRMVHVGQPVTLTAVATDDGVPEWFALPPRPTHVTTFSARGLRLAWFAYRGAGTVTFRARAVQGVGGPPSRREHAVGARLGGSAASPGRQVGGPGDVRRAWNLRAAVSGTRRRPHDIRGHHRHRCRAVATWRWTSAPNTDQGRGGLLYILDGVTRLVPSD